MKSEISLPEFIDKKQKEGYYWFNAQEYLRLAKINKYAFHCSVSRLARQKRVVHMVKNFYVILPLEYQDRGMIPLRWCIDALMKHLSLPYYVSVLTAASLLGFADQQWQSLQVMVNKQQILSRSRSYIQYLVKNNIVDCLFRKEKCETGSFNIAKKETLAFDLIDYRSVCGSLKNVVTVLYKMGHELDANQLAAIALHYPKTVRQRLGYLLDFVGEDCKTVALYEELSHRKINYITLSSHNDAIGLKNKKWHILINENLDR
jgi:predicted transcriptional regulator of viral defense system